jgi:hypothetical protein
MVIPVIPSQRRRAWPKCIDARPISYLPLRIALTRPFTTDAHLAAYSLPTHPYRLSSGAVGHPDLPEGVAMVLAMFDLDGHDHASIDTWWDTERPKVTALRDMHPGIYAYRTRSGARLTGALPDPITLRTREDAEAWRQQYLTWVAYLARAFGLHADPACKDWTHLYRLPHATREPGGQPEDHEIIGDARHVGVWAPTITPEDVAHAATSGKRPSARAPRVLRGATYGTGEGLLYHAFDDRGWIGQAIEAGKWAVACPWEAVHTRGERFDTSTVLWAPGPGEVVGWWYCAHAHCQRRDLRDVLGLFTPPELDRAKTAAGGVTVNPRGLRVTRHRQGIRTIAAQEVTPWRG